MPTIDTRHSEMDKLFTLLCVESGVTPIDVAIMQAKASMEQADVETVAERHRELIEKRKKTT